MEDSNRLLQLESVVGKASMGGGGGSTWLVTVVPVGWAVKIPW